MVYIALEIPLMSLTLAGRGQGHHPAHAGIETLRYPLDRATLARRIATLEYHNCPSSEHLAQLAV